MPSFADISTQRCEKFYELHVKEFSPTGRSFSGTATSSTPDRVDDVVEAEGVTFAPEIPLHLFHKRDQPVGSVRLGKATRAGIPFRAEIPEVTEDGIVKDLTDQAAHLVKYKLVRAVSIGFRPLDPENSVEFLQNGGVRFKRTEALELSLVSIPAQPDATIEQVRAYVKSFDTNRPAATGTSAVRVLPRNSSGASDTRGRTPAMAKTLGEQIKDWEATRAAKAARRDELINKSAEAGQTLEAQEDEEYDELKAEIEKIDKHLVRLNELEKENVAKAKAVENPKTFDAASQQREGRVISVKENLPPGIGFARGVKARIVARLDGRRPIDIAKEMYPSDTRLHAHLEHESNLRNLLMQIKAAVPAATTTVSAWAGALVDPTNLAGEFIEFLRPGTIIGRLQLRSVPTNVRLIEQTQGGTGYWVGQGAPKPLTAFGFAPITLSPTKVAAISVATEEALRFSSPSLDQLVRDSLRDALVERVDRDLLDPAEAGTANVQPASLTNGLVPLTSAGTSADNIRTDMANLVQTLRSANLRGPIAVVLPDSLLTAMAWMVNSLGQPEFPGLTGEGGTFNGIRFIGSEYVANQSGSGNMVVAIAEREVFQSDDGGVTVDASRETSLQMLDNPTNNSASATATTMVSMWQTNSVAFRGEWFINWQKRRSDAVVYMDDVNWGSIGSP